MEHPDPDLNFPDAASSNQGGTSVPLDTDLHFNGFDSIYACSRISFGGNYEIEHGVPLNPIGRTGLRGRGSLPRWGPNHAEALLVTRCYLF